MSAESMLALPFLERVTVFEIGDTIASAAAGMLLRQLGATVTKIVTPTSDHARLSRREVRAAIEALDRGKHQVHLESSDLATVLSGAAVVICDASGTLPRELRHATIPEYVAAVDRINTARWISIAPFGLSGPYAEYVADDLTSQASGGALALSRSVIDGMPVVMPGYQAEQSSGLFAAIAALKTLSDSAQVAHFEVSKQEAVLVTGPYMECGDVLLNCKADPKARTGGKRHIAPAGQFQCSDGNIIIIVSEERHWLGTRAAMDEPLWAAGITTAAERLEHEAEIVEKVGAWIAQFSKEEAAARLQAQGVPASPVNGPRDLRESKQYRFRGFADVLLDETQPLPLPMKIERHSRPSDAKRPSSRQTDDGRRIARVTEFDHVLAPPLAGSWLGTQGNAVTRVEDLSLLDSYRTLGPYVDGIAGRERGAYFTLCNASKSNVVLDVRSDEGRVALDEKIGESDVLIYNWGGWRAASFGMEFERLAAINPGLVFISASGYGHEGPLANYRAYGRNLHAYGGLIYCSRDRHGNTVDVDPPWSDLITAIYIDAVAAASALRDDDDAWWIDISMAEVTSLRLAAQILNDLDVAAAARIEGVDGFYVCSDGVELALAARDEEEIVQIAKLVGASQSAGSDVAALRDAVGKYAAEHSSTELLEAFQGVGVPASPVWNANHLADDPHLRARGFFQPIDHPVIGHRDILGMPIRPAGGAGLPLTAAPTLA